MWRILLFLSVLTIGAALVLRWWFGLRVLVQSGPRACRCDSARWHKVLGQEPPATTDTAGFASELGRQLRLAALAQWQQRDPKPYASRESSRRFGLAVPPLSAMVAVFAALLAKIPALGAIIIFIAATALAAVFGMLSLGSELRAIAITARALRESRAFIRSDDEDAVIDSAIAHAWSEAVPPVLRMLQKKMLPPRLQLPESGKTP